MKKLLLALTVCFGFVAQAQAQAQQISTFLNTDGPYGGIIIDGQDVYVASEFNGVIYKKNAVDTGNDYITINSGGTGSMQTGLCKLGDYLYVNRWHDNAVLRISLDGQTAPEAIATITHPEGLAGVNDKLYITSEDKIYEVNLATAPATVSVLTEGLEVSVFGPEIGLKIFDNYLYVSEVNKISRINLGVTPYVKETFTSLPFTPLSFAREEGTTFHATANDYHSVYTIESDINYLMCDTSYYGTDYPSPNDMVYSPEDFTLIIACMEGNNVMKVLIPVMATENQKVIAPIVYPNPATSYIAINGLTTAEEATVINTLGQAVAHYTSAQKYDVSALPAGVYYLKVKDSSLKFIKE